MSMRERVVLRSMLKPVVVACLLLLTNPAWYISAMADATDSQSPYPPARFGTPLSAQEIEHLPRHVFADGQGLPSGSGTTEQGQALYAARCAACHGSQGQGGRAIELVGDRTLLNTEYPDRGIAVYWPHAPTLFEYIYRSMPPDAPASLSTDQLYAIIAYLLQLNELLPEGSTLDAQSLSELSMPNQSGFETVGK